MSLLEVKNLSVDFRIGRHKTVNAVSDISFSLEKGRTLAVVGESGCGKSVTANSILQLLPKQTAILSGGEILLDGQKISALPPKAMRAIRGRRVTMIFQEPMTSLNPVYTIGRQMVEMYRANFPMSRKEAREKSIEMLSRVGIPAPEQRMKEFPHQLSGGLRQRVMIAMALSTRPELLIADEPTTALDVTIQAQVLELMKGLQREYGTAILLITHDMGVVAEMADDVLVMYAGQVMEYGTAQQVFNEPMHPYTRGLLNSIPRKDKDVDRLFTIKGTVPSLEEMPSGCHFCTRCPECTEQCSADLPAMADFNGHLVRCHHCAGRTVEAHE